MSVYVCLRVYVCLCVGVRESMCLCFCVCGCAFKCVSTTRAVHLLVLYRAMRVTVGTAPSNRVSPGAFVCACVHACTCVFVCMCVRVCACMHVCLCMPTTGGHTKGEDGGLPHRIVGADAHYHGFGTSRGDYHRLLKEWLVSSMSCVYRVSSEPAGAGGTYRVRVQPEAGRQRYGHRDWLRGCRAGRGRENGW